MSETILEIKNLAKFFDATKVLKDINLTVNKGDVIAVIGPSGSGKSTFLRCLNLLEQPTKGTLSFLGEKYFSITKNKEDFVDFASFERDLSIYEEELKKAEEEYEKLSLSLYQNKKDKYYGLYLYKKGFGGDIIEYPENMLCILNHNKYFISYFSFIYNSCSLL